MQQLTGGCNKTGMQTKCCAVFAGFVSSSVLHATSMLQATQLATTLRFKFYLDNSKSGGAENGSQDASISVHGRGMKSIELTWH